jgi:hypothetical protein
MQRLEYIKNSLQSEAVSLNETLLRVQLGGIPAFIDLPELLKATTEYGFNNDNPTKDLKDLQNRIMSLQVFEGHYLDRRKVNYSSLDYLNLKESLLSNNSSKFRVSLSGLYANWIGRYINEEDVQVDFYVDRDFAEIVKAIQDEDSGSFYIRLGPDMLWLCINVEQKTINLSVSNLGYSPLDDAIKKNYLENKKNQLGPIDLTLQHAASGVSRVIAPLPLHPVMIPEKGVDLEGHLPLYFQALIAAIKTKNTEYFLHHLLGIELDINRTIYSEFPEFPKYMEFFQLQQKLIRPHLAKEPALRSFLIDSDKAFTYTYVCTGGGYNKLVFTRKNGSLQIHVGEASLEDFKDAANKIGLPLRVELT